MYSLKHHRYKCLSSSGRIYISRRVTFDESRVPFKKKKNNCSFSSSSTSISKSILSDSIPYPLSLISPLLVHLPLLLHPIFPQSSPLLLEQLPNLPPVVLTWSFQLIILPQPPLYLLRPLILILLLPEQKMVSLSIRFSYQTILLSNLVILKKHSFMRNGVLLYIMSIMPLHEIRLGLLFLSS